MLGSPRSVTESSYGDAFFGFSEVSHRVLFGGWNFFSTTTYDGAYVVVIMSVCPRSVTESSLGDGIFFSTTTYGGAYVVVVMSVCQFVQFFFVCPRNYLNNVQDIIKVHFSQLRLVVSFNNILYT